MSIKKDTLTGFNCYISLYNNLNVTNTIKFRINITMVQFFYNTITILSNM